MASLSHLPTAIPNGPPLADCVHELVRQVPRGRVTSYGAIARALGDVRASRFVGQTLIHHPHGTDCHCHRVVRTGGRLGKYGPGKDREKATRLHEEGVPILSGERIDWQGYGWESFRGAPPLVPLAQWQTTIRADTTRPLSLSSETKIGGLDVSYVPSTGSAVACAVVLDAQLEVLEVRYAQTATTFPYIPGYLAFRELRPLMEAIAEIPPSMAPHVWMVDGSGVLHPRGCGVATLVGVATGSRTIGVTKKHLCGELLPEPAARARPIRHQETICGFQFTPNEFPDKPIYVSPGHGIDVESALTVVSAHMGARRLPAPIYWADRLSRQRARQMAR